MEVWNFVVYNFFIWQRLTTLKRDCWFCKGTVLAGDIRYPPAQMLLFVLAGALCRPQYCTFVLAGDISARQQCAPTTMLVGDSCMCHQSMFHVSAQIVFDLMMSFCNIHLYACSMKINKIYEEKKENQRGHPWSLLSKWIVYIIDIVAIINRKIAQYIECWAHTMQVSNDDIGISFDVDIFMNPRQGKKQVA
jgi:hypothetical protein